ncbi:PSPN protein, partial [Ramphastos sulfuratus]|nr:PSPN protein [Ramphastos sulfuratus]
AAPPLSPRGGSSSSSSSSPRCELRSRTLPVRELGLGYPSEELVRFRYCWGGCPSPPTNHGLVLARLKPWEGSAEGSGLGPC